MNCPIVCISNNNNRKYKYKKRMPAAPMAMPSFSSKQRSPSSFSPLLLLLILLLFPLFHSQSTNALPQSEQQQQHLGLTNNDQQQQPSLLVGSSTTLPVVPSPAYQFVGGIDSERKEEDVRVDDDDGVAGIGTEHSLPVVASRSAPPTALESSKQAQHQAMAATMAQLQQQQQQRTPNRKGLAPELFNAPRNRVSTVRAIVRLRLRHYSNPGRRMQNLTTCACPQNDDANCARNGGNRSPCFFTFVAVVGAADQIVDFHSTPFVVVDASGSIDASREAEWSTEIRFELPSKPQFVDIYAFNLGPVFGLLDGRIISWSETVWPVDAWQIDMDELAPYSWMEPVQMQTPRESQGRYDTGSQLTLELSVQCQDQFMGASCDLSCARNAAAAAAGNSPQNDAKLYGGMNRLTKEPRQSLLSTDQEWTICHSQLEESRSFECHFRDSRHFQVYSCRLCQFGVINGTICVHNAAQWREESADENSTHQQLFRTLTIVLAIALGIVLIILLVTCIFLWLVCRRRAHNSKVRRGSSGLCTYRSGIGAPYNISENGFGNNRLADPLMHPLLMGNNNKKTTTGIVPPASLEWPKPAQPPMAVQRSAMQHQTPQHVLMGTSAGHRSPHHLIITPTIDGGGIVDFEDSESGGGNGGQNRMMMMTTSSPNNSDSDYRPSPFTPRREAQV